MSSNGARRLWSDRAGTSAVEFALVAPAFLALLFGVFQLGWALHCNQSVDWATQSATRGLIGNPALTPLQLQAEVQAELKGIAADPTNVVVTTFTEDPTTASPRLAHVSVAYTHSIGSPFIPSLKYTYNTTSTVTLSP